MFLACSKRSSRLRIPWWTAHPHHPAFIFRPSPPRGLPRLGPQLVSQFLPGFEVDAFHWYRSRWSSMWSSIRPWSWLFDANCADGDHHRLSFRTTVRNMERCTAFATSTTVASQVASTAQVIGSSVGHRFSHSTWIATIGHTQRLDAFELAVLLQGGAALPRSQRTRPLPAYGALRCNIGFAALLLDISVSTSNSGSTEHQLSSQRSYVQWGCLAPATILHKQAVPGLRKPTCTLAGRDEQTGQFRTACAKEYPAELCRALVVTLSQGLHGKSSLKGLLPANYPSSKSGIATGWTVWPTSLPPVSPAIFFRTTSQSAKSLLLTAFKTARGTGPASCRMNEKIWKNQTCILLLHLFFPHKLAHLAAQVLTTTWSSPCATSTAVAPYCLRHRRIRRIRPLRSQQGKSWAWCDGRSFRAKTRMGSFTWRLGSVNFFEVLVVLFFGWELKKIELAIYFWEMIW